MIIPECAITGFELAPQASGVQTEQRPSRAGSLEGISLGDVPIELQPRGRNAEDNHGDGFSGWLRFFGELQIPNTPSLGINNPETDLAASQGTSRHVPMRSSDSIPLLASDARSGLARVVATDTQSAAPLVGAVEMSPAAPVEALQLNPGAATAPTSAEATFDASSNAGQVVLIQAPESTDFIASDASLMTRVVPAVSLDDPIASQSPTDQSGSGLIDRGFETNPIQRNPWSTIPITSEWAQTNRLKVATPAQSGLAASNIGGNVGADSDTSNPTALHAGDGLVQFTAGGRGSTEPADGVEQIERDGAAHSEQAHPLNAFAHQAVLNVPRAHVVASNRSDQATPMSASTAIEAETIEGERIDSSDTRAFGFAALSAAQRPIPVQALPREPIGATHRETQGGRDESGSTGFNAPALVAASVAEPSLHAALGETGRALEPPRVGEQIADNIVGQAEVLNRDGRAEFYLRLDPPDLGTVRVHLTATAHGVTARLVVADESVRQLVESQLGALRDSLSQAGLTLHRFDVSHDGSGETFQQWQRPDLWRAPAVDDFGGVRIPRPVSGPAVREVAARAGRVDVIA